MHSIAQIAVVNQHHAAKLEWNPSPATDFDFYSVYLSEDTNGNYREVGQTRETSFITDTLVEGRIYYFTVYAHDTSGNRSKVSDEVTIRI